MNTLTKNNLTKLAVLPGMVFLGTGLAQATTIPPTISSTLIITTNSNLTSNVTCTVTGAPCIKFGASGITLNLNGFSMTGNGNRATCTLNFGESGIDTNSRNNVSIRGPGLITRFNDIGIVVSGNNSEVGGVAITSSCREGIRVLGSNNEVERNSISRASLGTGSFFTGIFLSNPGGYNKILRNEVVGASNGGSGIFVGQPGAPSNNNLIGENDASGNPGVGIVILAGSTGNVVRRNQALGNVALEILDANAIPSKTYDNNLCELSLIVGGTNICKLPNIAGHSNPDDR